jgi:hypothetical protein
LLLCRRLWQQRFRGVTVLLVRDLGLVLQLLEVVQIKWRRRVLLGVFVRYPHFQLITRRKPLRYRHLRTVG